MNIKQLGERLDTIHEAVDEALVVASGEKWKEAREMAAQLQKDLAAVQSGLIVQYDQYNNRYVVF